ncbi:hypothetical protein N656DRAFT_839548 [Canariomyces notabilis]|uniref:Protein kinase domain-containing protein n=1 Tax=Canariomyces notabilis TaxID=2074819 RepID=A0AAN6QEN9_9PEZI|nr:hypothetical protein N656DRAFT_839548 [Canariomyces arenarius]
METTKNHNIQLLTTLVDPDDQEEGEYRFLVNGTHVKYVTVAPGTLPKDDRTFAPTDTGKPVFLRTEKADLPGVKTIWHATSIDHLQPRKLARLRQNIHIVSHPLFNDPVVIKFTEFPWQTPYFESETAAYQWIEGCDIEYIDKARAVGPADLVACQEVLKRLHALGVKHGDINKHIFMMREDGRCVLHDFETAKQGASKEELEEEYQRLSESLRDPSLRGAVPAVVLSEEMPN